MCGILCVCLLLNLVITCLVAVVNSNINLPHHLSYLKFHLNPLSVKMVKITAVSMVALAGSAAAFAPANKVRVVTVLGVSLTSYISISSIMSPRWLFVNLKNEQ